VSSGQVFLLAIKKRVRITYTYGAQLSAPRSTIAACDLTGTGCFPRSDSLVLPCPRGLNCSQEQPAAPEYFVPFLLNWGHWVAGKDSVRCWSGKEGLRSCGTGASLRGRTGLKWASSMFRQKRA